MLPGWLAVSIFLVYVAALMALARHGDRAAGRPLNPRLRAAIYALSSCVYYSSWSFFGSVGVASRRGMDFLPLYIGPAIIFAFFYPVIIRMIRLARAQNITSLADFVAARYGKAASVAAVVTVIAALAVIPFVALQIKAVSQALVIFIDGRLPTKSGVEGSSRVVAALVAALLAGGTIAIGTRRLDATEHQGGLVLVVAAESIIKLITFVAVGVFVSWGMFKGIGDLTERVARSETISAIVDAPPNLSLWLPLILITMGATLVLPRQFHVSVVENRNENDVRTAAWVVPLYIVIINLFVLPLAVAGRVIFPDGAIDRDFTILALPIHADQGVVTLLALIGGFSAATAMVFVATTALAVMVCNDLVMPLFLRAELVRPKRGGKVAAPPIRAIRRIAIVVILALSTLCADAAGGATLSSLGLTSVVCMVQVAPAAIGGLIWSRGTARGAIGGSVAGVLVCGYTLLLPAIVSHSSVLVTIGPLGIDALRPTDLFGLDLAPFQQGVVWSLTINVLTYVVLSLSRRANTNERLQANIFVRAKTMAQASTFRLRHSNVSVGELLATVSRYLSPETAERLFVDYHVARDLPFEREPEADAQLVQYAEHLIASAIGAASSRTVISLLLEKREMSRDAARRMIDDVAFEIQNSRDILQHAIDIARDGMAIYDSDLRLVAWNRAYRDMFQLPSALMRVGVPLDALIRSMAERGFYGQGSVDEFVASRLATLIHPTQGLRVHSARSGRVFEMRSVRLHNDGLFFTYTDATAQAQSEEELEAENETLERRVRERTEQLEGLNLELARAKADAEDANISKSRFLAAASHDILQPLTAARLYAASLRERLRERSSGDGALALAANVDASLEAVEDILGALLEISHLDAGATKTEITTFDIQTPLHQLKIEFEPMARERGLRLTFMPSSLRVTSDRKLLRRLLQNLVSNAIKYTVQGRVTVGVRRVGACARIEVYDTGLGIPDTKQQLIFREFERLPAAVQAAPGAGLGLSIVERLSRVLKHDIRLRSRFGRGSVFSVTLPRAEATLVAPPNLANIAPARQGSLEGLVVAAIDNETHILAGMEALLQGWDCVVARGTGLPEIEAALAAHALVPDVIVADYHVGDIDGLGIIAALRRRHGPTPAALITADRDTAVRDLAHAADVRVLHKPLKPAALRALLSQWRLVKTAAE